MSNNDEQAKLVGSRHVTVRRRAFPGWSRAVVGFVGRACLYGAALGGVLYLGADEIIVRSPVLLAAALFFVGACVSVVVDGLDNLHDVGRSVSEKFLDAVLCCTRKRFMDAYRRDPKGVDRRMMARLYNNSHDPD